MAMSSAKTSASLA